MKKMISIILAGAVVLGVSACKGTSNASEVSQAATTAVTTTKATTTTTTEETTTEETTTESSSETEKEKSFDELMPSEGDVFIDFSGKSSTEITENILNAIRLRTGTTAGDYAKRFSTPPKYTYSKGVWSFDWGKNKPKTNTFGKITIKAGKEDNKIVLDQNSTIKFKFYVEDRDIGSLVYDKLCKQISMDGESADYLKAGLAINPKRCGSRKSRLYRYQKYDYKWIEITVECGILPLSDAEQ